MDNSRQSLNDKEEEMTLKELIEMLKGSTRYIKSKWILVMIFGVIGLTLGLVYALVKKPVYTATATFVLEEGDSKGGLAAYAGIAAMVGLDLNGGGGGIFQGDNILELYKSRKMIQQTLLSRDTFNNKEDLLINRYIDYNNLRKKWGNKPNLEKINFDIPIKKFSLQHDSLIGKFVESIAKEFLQVTKPDKKLSIIKVDFKNKDELFAKSFTDNIVRNVNDFYVLTKTKKSSENLAILQGQADSVKRVLNYSIVGVAAAVDANPNSNPALQKLRVPTQKKQVDVQASSAVYQEIVKNLEMAKVAFRRDQPLIQVIDKPILPLKEDKPSIVISMLVMGFLTTLLGVMYLLIRNKLRNL